MKNQTALDLAAASLTATLAGLMAAASVMMASAAGQGFDRHRPVAAAMLAHGASYALGAGVLTVMARRTMRTAKTRY